MNPKITIAVDAKNRAIASLTGMVTVGAKVDVEITGLPDTIPNFGADDPYNGKSVRLRVVDIEGRDLVRFPLVEKTTALDGDQWTVASATATAPETYKTNDGTATTPEVNFNTDALLKAFRGVPFNEALEFGLVIDSRVDAAQYAVGKIKVRQWAKDTGEDPTVLPDWKDSVKSIVGATITGEKMKSIPTQKELTMAFKKVWEALGGAYLLVAAMTAFGEVTRGTEWWEIPPTTPVSNVVDLAIGGGGGGGVSPSVATNIAGRVTSNVVTKAYVEGLGISGGGVETNAVRDIARDLVALTNVAEFAEYAANSVVGALRNTNVVLRVDDGTLRIVDGGTNVWESSAGGGGIATNDVQGIIAQNVATNYLASKAYADATFLKTSGGDVEYIYFGNYFARIDTYDSVLSFNSETKFRFVGQNGFSVFDPDGTDVATIGKVENRVEKYNGIATNLTVHTEHDEVFTIESYSGSKMRMTPGSFSYDYGFDFRRGNFRSQLTPDGTPVATSNMVNGIVASNAITNGGAVASAKAYADATFLREANADYVIVEDCTNLTSGVISTINLHYYNMTNIVIDFSTENDRSGDAMLLVEMEGGDIDRELTFITPLTIIGDEGYHTAAGGKFTLFSFTKIASKIYSEAPYLLISKRVISKRELPSVLQ